MDHLLNPPAQEANLAAKRADREKREAIAEAQLRGHIPVLSTKG